ncbi:MAG TPA: amino acid permease [Pyrinomonadaceae bacterium]|nr:amino acid permease [Pyrinomonadaceae bacterium]
MKEEPNHQLVRSLTLTDSTALVVGKVIGTGIFLKAAIMTQQVQTPGLMLAAWAAAGLLSLAGALSYAELGAMFPRAGGEYIYLRAAYGRLPAFLYGWMQIAVAQTGIIAALGIGCATFLSALFPLKRIWISHTFHLLGHDFSWQLGSQQIVAIALILFFSAINCGGVALGGRTQTFLTAAKIGGIVAIVVGVFFFSSGGTWKNLAANGQSHWVGLKPFGAAMLAALWAYNGWNNLPMAAGEVRDPDRNLPRALIGGMLVVLTVYLLVSAAYVYALPAEQIVTSNSTAYPSALPVATKAAQTFLGPQGSKFISIIFILSTVGALNGGILTAARVPYAMARDGLLYSQLGEVNETSHAPVRAIAMQAVWACVLALSGTFDQLTDFAVFALWLFFALTTAAVFVLRRKMPGVPRPYRTIGYPVLPLVFILVAVWLVVNTLLTNPRSAGAGLALIALGVPLYYYFRRRYRAPE